MSIHRDCGEKVTWAKRDDDAERFMPPLEYIGEVYTIDSSGAAVQVHGYEMHRCDPEKILAWQEYQRRLAQAKGEEYVQDSYLAVKERDREDRWRIALNIECPRCEEPAGRKCHKLNQRLLKTGEIVECLNPHPERLEF